MLFQAQVYGGSAEQLRRFNVNIAPPENVWVQVNKEDGIWFKQVRFSAGCALIVRDHVCSKALIRQCASTKEILSGYSDDRLFCTRGLGPISDSRCM